MTDADKDPFSRLLELYRDLIQRTHPAHAGRWPVLVGHDRFAAQIGGWGVWFFKHTANPVMISTNGMGEIDPKTLGIESVTPQNIEAVRERLLKHLRATPDDMLVLTTPDGRLPETELTQAMRRHELALGLFPMKIFLSHKSPDKAFVRDFKSSLELLGFDPWLDDDAMAAGSELDRAILRGMKDSCAAVFFLTPNFSDEKYLADEINYARAEKRARPEFAIISIVIARDGMVPTVPDLLSPYVWKQPATDLEALREIIRALPVKVGAVQLR